MISIPVLFKLGAFSVQDALRLSELYKKCIHRPKGRQILGFFFYYEYIALLLLKLTYSVMKCDISVR